MFKKYVAEFIGTFGIVWCGTGAIIVNEQAGGVITHGGIAVVFGLIVMGMIFTFGQVSGAQFNPAVTLAFSLTDRFDRRLALPYIGSQLLGALAASVVLRLLFPENVGLGGTLPGGSAMQSLVLEVLLTYFLMLVILFTSQGDDNAQRFAPVAIGATVLLEAMFAGPICGASMNPARSFGPALVSGQWHTLWIYLLAPTVGAALAVLTWRAMRT